MPLEHGLEQEAAKPGALMVGIDEQLIDMRPGRRQEGDDRAVDLDHPHPVPLGHLAGVPAPHLVQRVGPVDETVRDPARPPVHPADGVQIRGRERPQLRDRRGLVHVRCLPAVAG
jgi:hypothetical protein